MNTNLKIKKLLLPKFIKAIKHQLLSGGDRYRLNNEKEMTDLICEAVGNDWIIGNILKYALEYTNTKLEQDLFKIATYAFILWLRDYEHWCKKDRGEEI